VTAFFRKRSGRDFAVEVRTVEVRAEAACSIEKLDVHLIA